jgi:hypothetical protein
MSGFAIYFVIRSCGIANDVPAKKSAHLSKRVWIGVAKHDRVFRIERYDKVVTVAPKRHQPLWRSRSEVTNPSTQSTDATATSSLRLPSIIHAICRRSVKPIFTGAVADGSEVAMTPPLLKRPNSVTVRSIMAAGLRGQADITTEG